MRFPLPLYTDMVRHWLVNRWKGNSRYPLVLMLEPTHQCNLNCTGCGRIREYRQSLDRSLSLEECLKSVEEAGAPVVTITGGEPFLYPHLRDLVRGVLKERRHIYLCTNGTLLPERLDSLDPHVRLSLNVHVDGYGPVHDRIMGRNGVFETVLEGIRYAKKRGFRVTTNTTVYKHTDPLNLKRLFQVLTVLDVNGILLSPAFDYESVGEDLFLNRKETIRKFREIAPLFAGYKLISTPVYLEFLQGRRSLHCTPWGNPTRNPMGWKSPCYLITDRHYDSFRELMERTDWERFAAGKDPRCRNCMVHCGFEPSVVQGAGSNLRDLWLMLRWNFNV